MLNRKIKKIGISMLTLAVLAMGGQTAFAASQGIEAGNTEAGITKVMNSEETINYIKTLITKDTMFLDKASGKMVKALDADLTNKETLNAVMEALIKEGKITKGVAIKKSENGDIKIDSTKDIQEGNTELRTTKVINSEETINYIKTLITKDTMFLDKASGKMVKALDADLTNKETLNTVMEALIKEGKIAKGVAIEKSENGDIKIDSTKDIQEGNIELRATK